MQLQCLTSLNAPNYDCHIKIIVCRLPLKKEFLPEMIFNPAPSLYNKIGLSRLHDEARTGLRGLYIFSAVPPLCNSNSQLKLELKLEVYPSPGELRARKWSFFGMPSVQRYHIWQPKLVWGTNLATKVGPLDSLGTANSYIIADKLTNSILCVMRFKC